MLGQLLHSITPSRHGSGRQTTPLESVTEDQYTRGLLYPDSAALHASQVPAFPLSATSVPNTGFPGNGHESSHAEIQLDPLKDVRIIVAQDEAGSLYKSVLFDSKPPEGSTSPATDGDASQPATSGSGGLQGSREINNGLKTSSINTPKQIGPSTSSFQHGHAAHVRRSSSSSEPGLPRSPLTPRSSAFQYNRLRGASISSAANIEEGYQGRTKESDDSLRTYLECMFGNTTLSYKGPSTKLHIIPPGGKPTEHISGRHRVSDGSNVFARGEARRKSNLAQSFTPSCLPSGGLTAVSELADKSNKERRTILITRTFSVSLPDDDDMHTSAADPQIASQPGAAPESISSNASKTVGGASHVTDHKRARQRRSPMYAIGIAIQLPASPAPFRTNPNTWKFGHKSSGLSMGNESLGSSLDSERRGGWIWIDPAYGAESMISNPISSEVDDRVDIITQHWDVIVRTLASLQFTAQKRIVALLRAVDANMCALPPSVRQPHARLPGRDSHTQFLQRRNVKLAPDALSLDSSIRAAAVQAAERVVRGIKIPRVVTGQGRWGMWREEARWVERWAGGRDQNFFFYHVLTAFLGSHTEWLSMLNPAWYRRRNHDHQRSTSGEDLIISNRTVIVSPNKMAARRLIFILSAFFPASQSIHDGAHDAASPVRPGTAISTRAYSQSPPVNHSVSRQPSLRRSINRRGQLNASAARSQMHKKKNHEIEIMEPTQDGTEAESNPSSSQARQAPVVSRARPVMTSSLPISRKGTGGRNGSTATTSTVTSESAVPVAHITMQRASSSANVDDGARPRSSESLASANLMNTLQRNNTGNTSNGSNDSLSATRWGSIMSFWSTNRRQSSTDQSELPLSADDGLCISGLPNSKPMDCRPRSELQQMVDEVGVDRDLFAHDLEDREVSTDGIFQQSPEQLFEPSNDASARKVQEISGPPKLLSTPLKLSVNESDGIIDVDIPMPAFNSPLQSPLMGGFNSMSSLEGSSYGHNSVCSCSIMDTDQPVYVAGWLKNFHPDFALQAVGPYQDLEKDIKRAMSAEPTPVSLAATPSLEHGPTETWVEVCSSLVADAQTYSVKRLRLRRRVRLIPNQAQPAVTPETPGAPPRSQYGNPYSQSQFTQALPVIEQQLEEEFIEEPIRDMDGTLADAVERLLVQSSEVSHPTSVNSSRSSSRRGRRNHRSGSDSAVTPVMSKGQCKEMVIGALREVVTSVTAELTRAENQSGEKTTDGGRGRRTELGPESTLREGVRKWLSEVEEAHANSLKG